MPCVTIRVVILKEKCVYVCVGYSIESTYLLPFGRLSAGSLPGLLFPLFYSPFLHCFQWPPSDSASVSLQLPFTAAVTLYTSVLLAVLLR